MMKITGLSHLFKWENLHNWWLTKYFFAPLYTVNEALLAWEFISVYVCMFTHGCTCVFQAQMRLPSVSWS